MRALNILITAGGTSEKIDDVRRITNSGTGMLGAKIAEAFTASGRICNVVYVCSGNAIRPGTTALPTAPRPEKAARQEKEARPETVPRPEKEALPGMATYAHAADGVGDVDVVSVSSVDVRVADDVEAVESAVRQACAETDFDVVVHSMAIGDYRIRAVSDADLMARGIIEKIPALVSYKPKTASKEELFRNEMSEPGAEPALACGPPPVQVEALRDALLSPPKIVETKISSDKENLIVVLEKAPKIIALYRGLLPKAVIVGFKLLSDVSEEELVQAGYLLLLKNDCDFVLANDMRTIRTGGPDGTDSHEGLLIDREGKYERAAGKPAIASLIVNSVLKLV